MWLKFIWIFVPAFNRNLYILFGCFTHKSGGWKASCWQSTIPSRANKKNHCGFTPEATSPESHQLQRICLNSGWAETLQELWDFDPVTLWLYEPLPIHMWQTYLKEMDTFIHVFFKTQVSWFKIAIDTKTHFKEYFKVPVISFFLRFTNLPLSGCRQHSHPAFHSPSQLVPFLPKHGDLQTL